MNRVVIVEDSHIMQQIYQSALSDTDFNIMGEAMDGNSALEMIQKLQPDIVILDLVLPKLSGVDVLKKISDISPQTKTVVITSVEDQAVLRQVKSLGAVFVIKKPFKKDQLLQTLNLLTDSKIEVKHG